MEKIAVIICLFAGLVLIIMGYLIRFKNKISLVHSYHYENVSPQDRELFCRGVGTGNIIAGAGIALIPLIAIIFTESAALIIGTLITIVGIICVLYTIIKYNHGLF